MYSIFRITSRNNQHFPFARIRRRGVFERRRRMEAVRTVMTNKGYYGCHDSGFLWPAGSGAMYDVFDVLQASVDGFERRRAKIVPFRARQERAAQVPVLQNGHRRRIVFKVARAGSAGGGMRMMAVGSIR